ncbi:phage head closure protein [Levilactobacillus brevis]|uniref:phage head closure protein n=1 Tax=Levilactobacillus brevis TaxID=1580 RepID=UPI00111FE127|nr:phage head closure protein [Levilactobacillus brevis]MUV40586.1 phage head closure protein [Levilactobacillus brevis]TOY76905.1 hypothetical protein DIS16_01025 [Levilactobacillus brevis]
MVKIRPHQLNHRAHFGTVKQATNPNTGAPRKAFVESFSLWAEFRTRSTSQLFAARQAGMDETRTIAVRRSPDLDEQLRVTLDSGKDMYRIVNISHDDTNNYLAFDFVTLEKTDAVKGA